VNDRGRSAKKSLTKFYETDTVEEVFGKQKEPKSARVSGENEK